MLQDVYEAASMLRQLVGLRNSVVLIDP
jgi:hypothetical protein